MSGRNGTRERRGKKAGDRRGPWRCAKCFGTSSFIQGQSGIGAQIRKCSGCGMMDRRSIVGDRRAAELGQVGTFAPSRSWGSVALIVASVLAALLALAGALIGSGVLS